MKKIIIYGTGIKGIQLYKWLIEAEIEHFVYAFCDRNYKNIKLPWKNIKVLPYEALKDNNFIYLVPLVKNEKIKNMLYKDNQEYYVCFQDFAKKYFSSNKKLMELFSTETFFLNDNNKLLEDYYHKSNYKIVEYDANREFCYIFFSSNDIYYPNDVGTFSRTIKTEDRFEWEHLISCSNVPQQAAKCIYIRDLHKTWYVTGINYKIDSLDKLIIFLKEITKGYKVITVGGSAGGVHGIFSRCKIKCTFGF